MTDEQLAALDAKLDLVLAQIAPAPTVAETVAVVEAESTATVARIEAQAAADVDVIEAQAAAVTETVEAVAEAEAEAEAGEPAGDILDIGELDDDLPPARHVSPETDHWFFRDLFPTNRS